MYAYAGVNTIDCQSTGNLIFHFEVNIRLKPLNWRKHFCKFNFYVLAARCHSEIYIYIHICIFIYIYTYVYTYIYIHMYKLQREHQWRNFFFQWVTFCHVSSAEPCLIPDSGYLLSTPSEWENVRTVMIRGEKRERERYKYKEKKK